MKQKLPLKDIIKCAHLIETEDEAKDFFLLHLWPDGIPTCPCCNLRSTNHRNVLYHGEFRGYYECKRCKHKFSLRTNTILANTKNTYKEWIRAFISYIDNEGYQALSEHIGCSPQKAYKMLRSIDGIYGEKTNLCNRDGIENMILEYVKAVVPKEIQIRYIADIKCYHHKKADNYTLHVLMPTAMKFTTVQTAMSKISKHIIESLKKCGAIFIERLQTGRPAVRENYDWLGKLPGDFIYTFYIGDIGLDKDVKVTYK